MRAAPFKTLLLMLFTILGTQVGCDPNDAGNQSSANCIGTAIIAIYDGALERRCGCQEGTGVFQAGTPLSCTLPVGTKLLLQFISTQQTHQIQVASLFTTPIVTPGNSSVQTYAVDLTVTGSLPFSDLFIPSLNGTLFVF
jgi:hypothetical protein